MPMPQKHTLNRSKNTNPRRIPRSEADVLKAYSDGFNDGMQDLMDLMVFTIGADMEMPDEWLDKFHERFMKNLECHVHGELTRHDLRSTLYAEKGWEVSIV